jgi:dTMP kinase
VTGRGRLIAFEGGEGSGKSTQARLLAQRIGAVLTREPGATAVGAAIRRIVLDLDLGVAGDGAPPSDLAARELAPRAEALLMAADRAQHVAEVIEPALASGRWVVTDRYLYSTLAYQGGGRGLDPDELRALSRFAGAPEADAVVLLTVPLALRTQRLGGILDRIERAGDPFHQRVDATFASLAAADPDRWLVVDGTRPVEAVAAGVWAGLAARVPDLASPASALVAPGTNPDPPG